MYEDFYGDDNQVTFDEDDSNVDDMAEKIMKEIYECFSYQTTCINVILKHICYKFKYFFFCQVIIISSVYS